MSFLSDVINRDVIDAGTHLKVIANYAVGYNNIDWKYAGEKGIYVTNTPDVLTDATADIAWSLILAVTRRIVPADRFTREGKFKGWDAFLFQGRSIQGKTLGIIGMGRIGLAVAGRGVAFGMKIIYHDLRRAPKKIEEKFKAVHRLENEADDLFDLSVAKLFEEKDAIRIMIMKEIYEFLEEITDKCEDVVLVIQDVVLKNA